MAVTVGDRVLVQMPDRTWRPGVVARRLPGGLFGVELDEPPMDGYQPRGVWGPGSLRALAPARRAGRWGRFKAWVRRVVRTEANQWL